MKLIVKEQYSLCVGDGGREITDLEVAKLSELFTAIIQPTGERLRLLMGDFMRANIATLGEFLVANLTRIWLLSSVASLMSL